MASAFSFVNGVMNPPIRAILRSPLHFLLDGNLISLTYTGRRSGRKFSLVTMYARFGNELIVFVGQPEKKKWWRNFHEKAFADVRFKGQRYACAGQLLGTDPSSVIPRLEAYCSKHSSSARLYGLRKGENGKFNSEDIAKAAGQSVIVVFDLPSGEAPAPEKNQTSPSPLTSS